MNECKNLKNYILYQISLYGLTRASVERATGISINGLQRFPTNYTGPSLREICELLSVDEADAYSRYQYIPTECLDLLFDYRFMDFFLWLSRTDAKTKSDLLQILEDLKAVDQQEPSQLEQPSENTE